MRRFALIGNRAMSQGKLPLNDMAGGAGRMDVLVRALMASLLTSHGLRHDTEVILHLHGGPGSSRRIKFVGSLLKGVHAEERAVAGQIAKVLKEPIPPRGNWIERSAGIFDGGGELRHTLDDWNGCKVICLDAHSPRLWVDDAKLLQQSNPHSDYQGEHGSFEVTGIDIGFILSDDKPLPDEVNVAEITHRSLGDEWLQGHMAIGICHFLLDEGVELRLD
jgi:hypothetical protein|tara:strand:- start:5291 stop:5950 length:660 start_codon:yes stop_codon:yes gene_type:complete